MLRLPNSKMYATSLAKKKRCMQQAVMSSLRDSSHQRHRDKDLKINFYGVLQK